MVVRWVVVCMALLTPMTCVLAAEPTPAKPAKASKRNTKAPKAPAPKVADAKPLHLAMHSLKRHQPQWHLESVPVPGPNPQGKLSGLRALALVGPLNDTQRVEFGVAPVVPLKLPSSFATGPDGVVMAGAGKRNPAPAAQVYLRYSW